MNELHRHGELGPELGQIGVINLSGTGTTEYEGDAYAIQILADAEFSTFEEDNAAGDAMTGILIPQGTLLRGRFTHLVIDSGFARVHKS